MAPYDPFGDPQSIAHSLDFSTGHSLRAKVRDLFSTPVNPISSSSRFFLVVSFGRSSFRLNDLNVSLALSACLGAAYDSLDIMHLSGRVYRFSVCSKAVGFLIQRRKFYAEKEFKCFFHLWGSGGPNWEIELFNWHKESDAEWTKVRSRRTNHMQSRNLERASRPHGILTGANAVLINSSRNFASVVRSPIIHEEQAGRVSSSQEDLGRAESVSNFKNPDSSANGPIQTEDFSKTDKSPTIQDHPNAILMNKDPVLHVTDMFLVFLIAVDA
jgi:hypothetical protein